MADPKYNKNVNQNVANSLSNITLESFFGPNYMHVDVIKIERNRIHYKWKPGHSPKRKSGGSKKVMKDFQFGQWIFRETSDAATVSPDSPPVTKVSTANCP